MGNRNYVAQVSITSEDESIHYRHFTADSNSEAISKAESKWDCTTNSEGDDFRIEFLWEAGDYGELLSEGVLDAIVQTNPIASWLWEPRKRTCLSNRHSLECITYFNRVTNK